ncbi:MAG: hypothetical protein VKJ24_05110 [Synechococcales bacterium]|nr:hypothetical protein [Synechococcales bacterium]
MTLPPNDVLSKGFSAGIQVWLTFLLAFYLLGYPAPLSIVLGAIGGIAGGIIIAWWEGGGSKKEEKKEEIEEGSVEDIAEERKRRRRRYARMRHARRKEEFSWDSLLFWKRS